MRILVVEDDDQLAETLVHRLGEAGHETIRVRTGARALELFEDVELVMLSLELEDLDGLDVCRRIRAAGDLPIIAFTDRGSELDRVRGLRAGADDCLGKPYTFRELMARVDAVMWRVRLSAPHARREASSTITCGPLAIDTATREVRLDGTVIEVTRKEFDLLHYLASRPGTVLTRQQLMAEIWDDPMTHVSGPQASRTIDTHVSALRGKLGDNRWIRTVRGVGFRFEEPVGTARRA
ncbi:response regulator transcription factor [Streptomyces sp. NPDC006235]|uniref:response regulator transcription factor n=1 Tax=Streptomyces sp. NPDC006235 TaxID=3156736 RepID=UPI0033A8400B